MPNTVSETGIDKYGVLVVEDSQEMRRTIQGMLADLGCNQVFVAKDGLEALHFLDDCGDLIDIVLADWTMPQMTGAELLGQVRSVDPDMPFVMISGRADKESILEAKSRGVTSYISKPFSLETLEKKLKVVARIMQAT